MITLIHIILSIQMIMIVDSDDYVDYYYSVDSDDYVDSDCHDDYDC